MNTDPINSTFRQESELSKAPENSENVLKNSSLISWPLKDFLNIHKKQTGMQIPFNTFFSKIFVLAMHEF